MFAEHTSVVAYLPQDDECQVTGRSRGLPLHTQRPVSLRGVEEMGSGELTAVHLRRVSIGRGDPLWQHSQAKVPTVSNPRGTSLNHTPLGPGTVSANLIAFKWMSPPTPGNSFGTPGSITPIKTHPTNPLYSMQSTLVGVNFLNPPIVADAGHLEDLYLNGRIHLVKGVGREQRR